MFSEIQVNVLEQKRKLRCLVTNITEAGISIRYTVTGWEPDRSFSESTVHVAPVWLLVEPQN